MKFKVGDWVEFYDMYEKFNPFKIEEKHLAFPTEWWESITLWKPASEDWCWFWNYDDRSPVIAQYSYFSEGYVTKTYVDGNREGHYYSVTFDFCEPFLGILPSVLN